MVIKVQLSFISNSLPSFFQQTVVTPFSLLNVWEVEVKEVNQTKSKKEMSVITLFLPGNLMNFDQEKETCNRIVEEEKIRRISWDLRWSEFSV